MPESASTPIQPSPTARATRSSHGSPAATRTTAPPQASESALTPAVRTATTRPSKPASETSTLEPPPSTRTGVPDSSASRTASRTSASVVATTNSAAGPPTCRVVWSASSSATQDRRRPTQHLLAPAGHRQQDGPVVLHVAGHHHLGSLLGNHDGADELRADLTDLPGLGELLVDVPGGEGEGVHAVRDHPGQPDAAGDRLVLVDRVVVTARLGVGHEVGARDPIGALPHQSPTSSFGDECTRVAWAVQTSCPSASVMALEVLMMSAPPIWRSPVTVSSARKVSPARTGRSWTNFCWPCTTWCSSMPTSGARIRACIASNATTIGNVAGAGPPGAYAEPVAAAKAARRSSVTSRLPAAGNVRPDREGSTGMALTVPVPTGAGTTRAAPRTGEPLS